jgi:hypothetical protein
MFALLRLVCFDVHGFGLLSFSTLPLHFIFSVASCELRVLAVQCMDARGDPKTKSRRGMQDRKPSGGSLAR